MRDVPALGRARAGSVAWPTRDEAVAFAQETLRVRDDLAYLGPIPVSP